MVVRGICARLDRLEGFGTEIAVPTTQGRGLLEGISLGARMPQANVDKLLKIAASHVPALPVWQAREKDTYEFEFERLA